MSTEEGDNGSVSWADRKKGLTDDTRSFVENRKRSTEEGDNDSQEDRKKGLNMIDKYIKNKGE